MADYPVGGGGGPAGHGIDEDSHAYNKAYDFYGDWTPYMSNQLNEMMTYLVHSATKNAAAITTLQATPAAAAAAAAEADVKVVSVSFPISSSVFTTGVSILAPPGADLTIVPICLTLSTDHTAIGGTGSWHLLYDDPSHSGFVIIPAISADLNNLRDKVFVGFPSTGTLWLSLGTRTPVNMGVRLWLTVDPTTATGTVVATFCYHVASTPV